MPNAAPLRASVGRIALALHGFGSAAWIGFMAGGFPPVHPRFVVNRAIPSLVVAATVFGAIRPRWRPAVLLGLAAAWVSGGIAGRICFPVSLAAVWWLAVAAAGVLTWASGGSTRLDPPRRPTSATAWALGALIGASLVLAERPPPPSTAPALALDPGPPLTDSPIVDALDPILCGPLRVSVDPYLDFDRVSPDGAWSLLAPSTSRADMERSLSVRRAAGGETMWTSLSAVTALRHDTYAHLASFTRFWIEGHVSLAVRFSPAPQAAIAVLPSDYPTGRPARAAYLDDRGELHVVEATSGEKGPFHTLAAGQLDRDQPLTLTLLDAGRPVCKLTVVDWASQASTALSPTAGWGLPQNAIELDRLGDADDAPVVITLALAATSLGRGWDAVGHAAGLYRNRVVVEALVP